MVGDHVVQIARDAHAFLGDPAPGLFLPCAFGVFHAFPGRREVLTAAADGAAERGGRDREVQPQQTGPRHQGLGVGGGVDTGDRHGRGYPDRPRGAPTTEEGEGVQGDQARSRGRRDV